MPWLDLEIKNSTPYSSKFNDFYYSVNSSDGLEESYHNFISPAKIAEKSQLQERIFIAELGFGTGINFINTSREFLKNKTSNTQILNFSSCEKYPLKKNDLKKIYDSLDQKYQVICQQILEQYPKFPKGIFNLQLNNHQIKLSLYFGEVQEFTNYQQNQCDAWFLDGFAPNKNPEMWKENIIENISRKTITNGTIHSFSVQGEFRRKLERNHFLVKKQPGYKYKRECLIATKKNVNNSIFIEPWFQFNKKRNYKKKHAIIIGAGISGCTIAYQLAKRKWKVSLIEKNEQIAQGSSQILYGLLKPKLIGDKQALINQWAYYSFLYTYNAITQLENKESFIQEEKILELDSQDKYNEDNSLLFELKDGYISSPYSLVINMPEYCKQLIKNKFIQINLSQDITNIEYKNSQWNIYDKKQKLIKSAPVIIIATTDYINNSPIIKKSLRYQFGRAFLIEKQKNYSYIKNKNYLINTQDYNFIGSSYQYDLKEGEQKKQLLAISKKLEINTAKNLASFQGKRVYSPNSLPLTGEAHNYDKLEKYFPNLSKGHKPSWYKEILASHCYLHSSFGSKALSQSLLTSELLANQINNENILFPCHLLKHLEANRIYINHQFKNKGKHI